MHQETSFIGLITDFGERDPYVAAMKAVIAAGTRSAILDLSHAIAPFDVVEASWFLRCVVPWTAGGARSSQGGGFKSGVIVCVVDPGVGSERRIVAGWRDRLVVLAPDNGVLTFVAPELALFRSVENDALFLPQGSATFHGRDRFAPVAAALTRGIDFASLGPEIERRSLARFAYDEPSYGEPLRGTIVSIDRFGNIVTDVDASRAGRIDRREMKIGSRVVRKSASTYVEGEPLGEPFMIVGSQGTIEVSVARGSAADALGAKRLQRVEIEMRRR